MNDFQTKEARFWMLLFAGALGIFLVGIGLPCHPH